MRNYMIFICIIVIFSYCTKSQINPVRTDNEKALLKEADFLFKSGKFNEAEKLYYDIVNKEANLNNKMIINDSMYKLASIYLLENCLDEALNWLNQSSKLVSEDPKRNSIFAEIYYRRDDFEQAVPYFQKLGRKQFAEALESFKSVVPYKVESVGDVTSVPFVITDPLPVIQVTVNDSKIAQFFIDTGASVINIDETFAKELGIEPGGSETGTFAGGKTASFNYSKIDTLQIGDFKISNIPVMLMDVRQLSDKVFGGLQVDGIIGTVFLYHFLSTLDYRNGKLILRKNNEENNNDFEKVTALDNIIAIPFWMAGDHYMVSWGTVNKSQPLLLFIDTGLANCGFLGSETTLKEANVYFSDSTVQKNGIGMGGKTKYVDFTLDEITLGDAHETKVCGHYNYSFDLEYTFGFRIGGLISHSFFKQYAVTFDFNKMKLFLQKQ